MKEGFMWNRRWLWGLILFVIALFLSYAKLILLAGGGEVTFLSMFFLYLIGYCFGGLPGLAGALLFGLLKGIMDYPFDGVPEHIVAEWWDYILGFGVIGLGGFFSKASPRGNGTAAPEKEDRALIRGFIIAAVLRYLESIANYLIFYYRPEKTAMGNVLEAMIYCFAYVGMEALLTLVVLMIPAVRQAIRYAKRVATTPYEEDLDSF